MAKFSFIAGQLERFECRDDWQMRTPMRRDVSLVCSTPYEVDDVSMRALQGFMTGEHMGKRIRVTIETVDE